MVGADVLTPDGVLQEHALLHRDGVIEAVTPVANLEPAGERIALEGGLLAPGFVDLQVNGGGGAMFNNAPDVETLRRMADAHVRIGATSILPTLITDTPEVTGQAVAAVIDAIAEGIPGILGLHLEGPHLSPSRKGAHDATLIRPMQQPDLERILAAAAKLPLLKVTVAPESVSTAQISAMAQAGVLVSLGHSDAGFAACAAAARAGARCVTHLFNAQSQMGNREPGTVGAALALGEFSAGMIADGIHVHPTCMRNAIHAKAGPGRIFLVSDAMATAGSDITCFQLNGRKIHRAGNRLTLADGTLAGAHLELLDAARTLSDLADVAFPEALDMAGRYPADLIGQSHIGRLSRGARADFLHIGRTGGLEKIWQQGREIVPQRVP